MLHFEAWFEPWEKNDMEDESDSAHNYLLTKYHGLKFADLDPPNHKFKIENKLIWNDSDDK